MILCVLWVECVSWSPLVGRVIGHLQVWRDQVQRSPRAAGGEASERPGGMRRRGSGG